MLGFVTLLSAALAAPSCPDGQVTVNRKGNCCWPGQGWSWSKKQCTGMPRECPPGWGVERPPPGSSKAPYCHDFMASGRQPGSRSTSLHIDGPVRHPPKVPLTEHMSLVGPSIIGALDQTLIEGVLLEHSTALGQCAKAPVAADMQGTVGIKFSIDRMGLVSSAETRSDTLGHPDTGACLSQVLMGLEFPKPIGGGIAVVRYIFAIGGP